MTFENKNFNSLLLIISLKQYFDKILIELLIYFVMKRAYILLNEL
jgi:hypothetical protein